MPFQPIPGAVRSVVHWTKAGNDIINTFYYRRTAGGSSSIAELAAINLHIATNIVPRMQDVMHSSCQLLDITSTSIHVAGGPQDIYTPPNAVFGLVAGVAAPGNVGVVIGRRTPFVGKRFRGYIMMGGLSKDMIAGDFVTSFYPARYGFLAATLLLDPLGGSFQAGHVSRAAGAIYDLTRTVYDSTLDDMGRRLTGHGS